MLSLISCGVLFLSFCFGFRVFRYYCVWHYLVTWFGLRCFWLHLLDWCGLFSLFVVICCFWVVFDFVCLDLVFCAGILGFCEFCVCFEVCVLFGFCAFWVL